MIEERLKNIKEWALSQGTLTTGLPEYAEIYIMTESLLRREVLVLPEDELEKLRAENAKLREAAMGLRDALSSSRGQWVHSVNAEKCLSALEKFDATTKDEQ